MPLFAYVAKDLDGVYHKGEIEISSESQATNLLRRKKLIIISLKTKNAKKNNFINQYLNKVPFGDVVIVTRQLATMIQAGLVISEALDILEEEQSNKHFREVLQEVSSDIKGGADFSAALEKHPDVFPPLYSRLVRAGQISGKLDTILIELSESLEKERAFRGKVKGAMIYPIVVVTMMAGVMLIMVFFVMPKLLGVYKDSGIDLPLPTKIMLSFANFMIGYWWALLTGIVLLVVSFRRYASTPGGRLRIDGIILKLPVIGKITKLVVMTNFTRTFALLVGSGLSILESIKIVSEVSGNLVYKNGFDLAYQGVERGLSFSSQILSLPVFPKIVGQMMRTGEETGKIEEVISKIADYFESETDTMLKNVTTLIEPIVLVLLGVGVAFLVVSIILPIYQLTTNIK